VADCGGGGVKVRLGVRVSGEGSAAARVCAEARWSGWRHAATTRNISSSRARVLSAPSAAGVGRGTAGVKGGSSQGKGGFRVSGVFLPDLRGGSGVVMMYEAHVQHRGSPPAAPAARPATAPVHARWKQREGKGRRPGVWVCTEPNGWAGFGFGSHPQHGAVRDEQRLSEVRLNHGAQPALQHTLGVVCAQGALRLLHQHQCSRRLRGSCAYHAEC
jgi:hypothetical protein